MNSRPILKVEAAKMALKLNSYVTSLSEWLEQCRNAEGLATEQRA
jgi:hypothetical protein